VHVHANNIKDMQSALHKGDVCAVMMELVQGEGGVCALDRAYVGEVAAMCKSRDILLIIDEVQTGNGRTGTLYAFEQFGIHPDIVSTAKGLAGGLPIGATLFNEKTQDVLTPGAHGSTFGGNPVSCAGALSILSRIDEPLLESVREKSDYIIKELTGAPGVRSITGMGLMLGIAVDKPAKDILKSCLSRGVVVLTAKDKIRLLPPLTIPFPLLKEAINILKEEIAK